MLNVLLLFFYLSLGNSQTCSSRVVPGPITWNNGGSVTTGYLIQSGGSSGVSASGSTITSNLNPRFYLANSCVGAFGPSVFQLINPLGATISFTANLSSVGCALNSAFYLVGMPAPVSGSFGDYYCDANCYGGCCCTEMDLMEANRHAMQITPHRCTNNTNTGCDPAGCYLNTQTVTPNGYGPDASFTINTQNPFNVSTTFYTTNNQLSSITTIISQGSNAINLTHNSSCGMDYLSGMSTAFQNGMVIVWSFWTGEMSWLDSPACTNNTNEMPNPQFIFSNLVITGAGAVTPVPPIAPSSPPSSPSTAGTRWIDLGLSVIVIMVIVLL